MKRFLKIAIPLLVVTAGLLVGCHFLFIRSHTISFESNGGTPVASITLRFGTPMEAPEEPVKEGETFCGWYQDAELTHPYDFVFMGASDLLLYAAWSSPGLSFVLNDAQDGYVVSLGDARATGRIVVPAETGGLPVTEVAESGFRDCPALEEVFLPDSVEIIRANAFFSCERLSFVHLPSALRIIGARAFEGCAALLSPEFPSSLRTVSAYAFSACTSLTSLVFPEGLETVAEFAFQDCTSVGEAVFPGSLLSVGRSAFTGCSGLVSLSLPFVGESRTAPAAKANFGFIFGVIEYTGSTRIVQNYSAEQTTVYYLPNSLQHVVLTEGTSLPYGAFSACFSLVSVVLPGELAAIPGYAFVNCYFLTDLAIPAGVTAIGDYAFYGCQGLSGQPLPSGLVSLGAYAFAECTGLTALVIPDTLTDLPEYAFKNCWRVVSLDLPDTLVSIGKGTFKNCAGLVSVFLPASLETVGKDAFSLCTSAVFRAASPEQPEAWDTGWNPAERPVTWGASE